MSQRRKLMIAGLAVVVTAAVAFFLFSPPRDQGATIRLGYLNITASLPLFIAEEEGFFEEEGLMVETQALASSNQLVDGIVAGNLDAFIESSAVPVLVVEQQSPGRLKVFSVSSITAQTPFDALLVREDSPIENLSDLAGKKIGVFPGSTATNLLRKYLSDSGVDVTNISFTPMPPPNHLAALLQGAVDAIHAYEPTTAIAMSKGGVRKIYGSVYASMLAPNPQGVAVVSSQFIREHPEAAKKVIRALEKAMVFMLEQEADARRIMAKRMKLTDAVASRTVFLYMLPHAEIDTVVFQKYANMLTELGELKGAVKVDGLLYRD